VVRVQEISTTEIVFRVDDCAYVSQKADSATSASKVEHQIPPLWRHFSAPTYKPHISSIFPPLTSVSFDVFLGDFS